MFHDGGRIRFRRINSTLKIAGNLFFRAFFYFIEYFINNTIEPDEDYIIPLGKANVVQEASAEQVDQGNTLCIITYGMGVYWAKNASKQFPGSVEIIDLRTLNPCDDAKVFETVRRHGKCIVLNEEQVENTFAQALSGRIAYACFRYLDAPVKTIGAKPLPAVAMNMALEKAMLPGVESLTEEIRILLES